MRNLKRTLTSLASLLLAGCLGSDEARFGCDEKGVVANSGSNWVFAVDTGTVLQFATKHPIAYTVEIFDAGMQRVNSSGGSLDSAMLSSLPMDSNGFRRLGFFFAPVDKQGKALESGCYKARLTVNALRTVLDPGDIPGDGKTKVGMEWIFGYIRSREAEASIDEGILRGPGPRGHSIKGF